MAAYWRELHAYSHVLRPLQGQVVPRLLSAGHIVAGVCFIAISYIPGQPLSDMGHISPTVADAAVRALQHVHTASERFVRADGDIQLHNVMHMAPVTGQVHTSTECMIIDFGQSYKAAAKAAVSRVQRRGS